MSCSYSINSLKPYIYNSGNRYKAKSVELTETQRFNQRYIFNRTITAVFDGYAVINFSGDYLYFISSDGLLYLFDHFSYTYEYSEGSTTYTFYQTTQEKLKTADLRLVEDYYAVDDCSYNLNAVESLKMAKSSEFANGLKTKELVEVKPLKNSFNLVESFDGSSYERTITFGILLSEYPFAFDIISFLDNSYSFLIQSLALVSEDMFPSFSIDNGIIHFTFTSRFNRPLESEKPSILSETTTFVPVSEVVSLSGEKIKSYECSSEGVARYLAFAEINALGNPTGVYETDPSFKPSGVNIIGDALTEEYFKCDECIAPVCRLNKGFGNIIEMNGDVAKEVVINSPCGFSIYNVNGIVVEPLSGEPDTDITLEVYTNGTDGSFTLSYGDTEETVEVKLQNRQWLYPLSFNVSYNNAYIGLTCLNGILSCSYPYTKEGSRLTINIGENNTTSAITKTITVTSRQGTETITVLQQGNSLSTEWKTLSTYCDGNDLYKTEVKWVGGKNTGEMRNVKIASNASECRQTETGSTETTGSTCLNGNLYKLNSVIINGVAQQYYTLGEVLEYNSSVCQNVNYTYEWRVDESKSACNDNHNELYVYLQYFKVGNGPFVVSNPKVYSTWSGGQEGQGSQNIKVVNSPACGYEEDVTFEYKWVDTDEVITGECQEYVRWINTDETICVGGSTYRLQQKQVSSDNVNFESVEIYRQGGYLGAGECSEYYEDSSTLISSSASSNAFEKQDIGYRFICNGKNKHFAWKNGNDYLIGELYQSNCTDCTNTENLVYRWKETTTTLCDGYDEYYQDVYQVSYDNGLTFRDVSPLQTRKGRLKTSNSTACGFAADVLERYLSIGEVCGNEVPENAYEKTLVWHEVSGEYLCIGGNKYKKLLGYEKIGSTETPTNPAVYKSGSLIEFDSLDCAGN